MQTHTVMPRLLKPAILLFCVAVGETGAAQQSWTFDADQTGALPTGFIVGTMFDGRPAGTWRVIDAPGAPSPPHVLAQLTDKGAEHAYKLVLIEGTTAAGVDLDVSFLAVAGKGDMGGGVIWRAQDDRNYYLARVNPLEQNIRVYRVVRGVRELLANANRIVPIHAWHRLRVVTRGDHIQIVYDGAPVLDLRDQTFRTGRVGLWTKSDAVTYFDNVTLTVLK